MKQIKKKTLVSSSIVFLTVILMANYSIPTAAAEPIGNGGTRDLYVYAMDTDITWAYSWGSGTLYYYCWGDGEQYIGIVFNWAGCQMGAYPFAVHKIQVDIGREFQILDTNVPCVDYGTVSWWGWLWGEGNRLQSFRMYDFYFSEGQYYIIAKRTDYVSSQVWVQMWAGVLYGNMQMYTDFDTYILDLPPHS
ncbi:MAG: hypothetical protein NWE95_09395 [Candidatus Bathyarchaeota archaeon]|nr:hypothetical protein [Candidatus Bathyarchaeota archaeon]